MVSTTSAKTAFYSVPLAALPVIMNPDLSVNHRLETMFPPDLDSLEGGDKSLCKVQCKDTLLQSFEGRCLQKPERHFQKCFGAVLVASLKCLRDPVETVTYYGILSSVKLGFHLQVVCMRNFVVVTRINGTEL